MGRKIPAKKHRGVKDPLVQQAKRLQDLQGKINAPPKDPDEQPVPRSLIQLFAFQNRSKTNKKATNAKKKQFDKDTQGAPLRHENPVARLQKLPGESGRGFSLRINSAIKTLHNPSLEENYPQDVEAEDAKGERMAHQRARRKKKLMKKTQHQSDEPPPPSRAQRLSLKKKAKREKLLQAREHERELHYERVPFGEVAHAPPALPAPRRRAAPAASGAPRPGRRGLLLSALLPGAAGPAGALPAVELERRERARLSAVAAYRALKKARTTTAASPALVPL
ncbi:coiled-coil domain-containing protein 137 [Battus philenor]|uniref:coiled-coil domain-containing protein 137 n=1 Tax=Battus philenor TaxID=42288 RepID=UPI0035D0F18B